MNQTADTESWSILRLSVCQWSPGLEVCHSVSSLPLGCDKPDTGLAGTLRVGALSCARMLTCSFPPTLQCLTLSIDMERVSTSPLHVMCADAHAILFPDSAMLYCLYRHGTFEHLFLALPTTSSSDQETIQTSFRRAKKCIPGILGVYTQIWTHLRSSGWVKMPW